jgi:transposase-like protein
MHCPHCASPTSACQSRRTVLGYQIFRCAACRGTFSERTGTPFNFLEYPTDIVLLVVLWLWGAFIRSACNVAVGYSTADP